MLRRGTKAEDRVQTDGPLPFPFEFVVPLWRHRLLFAATFLGVSALAILVAYTVTPKYVATGSVILAEPDPALTRTADAWSQKLGDPADLESQVVILESSRLLGMAAQQPGVYDAVMAECRAVGDSKCLDFKPASTELTDYVAKRYSAGAAGRSRVIEVSYRSPLPATAKTMANALVETYLDDQKASMSDGREVAAKWLWQELADLDQEIRDSDAKIEAYRRENGLVRGATAPISSERLSGVAQQLALAEQARAQAQARLDAIRDVRNGSDAASTSNVLDSRTVADLKQQISTARRNLAARSAVLGPRHPQLLMLRDSLSSLQRQMQDEIDRISSSAQKDYDTAVAQVAALQQQMNSAQATAATAASDESSIEGMVRDVEVKRQLYAQLYQRASEMETERRSLAGSARLVSLAETPLKPYFPKKSLFAAAGVLLGLMLASLACILWDTFRRMGGHKFLAGSSGTVSATQIEPAAPAEPAHAMSTPADLVAALPDLPSPSLLDASTMTLGLALRRSTASRSMQDALTDLLHDLRQRNAGKPMLILPADEPGPGPAFLTLALGQAAARSGLMVLAIECSPKRADFVTALGMHAASPGLSEILSGELDPVRAAAPTATHGLHVIVAGNGDLDLSRAVHKRRFQTLVDWAEPYDLVLMSAASAIGDTSTVSALPFADRPFDTLVCVGRAGATEDVLREAQLAVARSGGHVLGTVVLPRLDIHDNTSNGYDLAGTEIA
ncbi:GumC family protein [Rhizobium sp. PAMB 3174]